MIRRIVSCVIVLMGVAGIVFLLRRPYHDGLLRYGMLASMVAVWAGLLALAWKPWGLRVAVVLIPVLLMLTLLLPGGNLDHTRLKEDYVKALQSYVGTPYIWGGEGRGGIDCSGLPRAALRQALLEQAKECNTRAARLWLAQWWFDTSAKAMAEEYRGFTHTTGISGDLRQIDLSRIRPGDLAVTKSQSHVMVYLGAGVWIQAEPLRRKVIVAPAGSPVSVYLSSEVTLYRWQVMEAS